MALTWLYIFAPAGGPPHPPPPTGMKIPGETEEKYPGLKRQGKYCT